jgi:hypothetical protein
MATVVNMTVVVCLLLLTNPEDKEESPEEGDGVFLTLG